MKKFFSRFAFNFFLPASLWRQLKLFFSSIEQIPKNKKLAYLSNRFDTLEGSVKTCLWWKIDFL